MERYDYADAVRSDCEEVLKEIISNDEFSNFDIEVSDYDDADEFKDAVAEKMTEPLLNSDSVTGAGSGSYYCNAYKAEESLCHNLDLLADACDEFGLDLGQEVRSAEGADIIIRQYEVYHEIERAVENISEELEQYFDEKMEEMTVDKD